MWRKGVVVILRAALVGCGAPPSSANVDDFCSQLERTNSQTQWKRTQREAAKLKRLGTPSNMPARAREGFVALVVYTEQSGSQEALVERTAALRGQDRSRHEALESYVRSTCEV